MWIRDAFYEMVAEVLETFAADLRDKLDRERSEYCVEVKTPTECDVFLLKGCILCQGFRPFYDY